MKDFGLLVFLTLIAFLSESHSAKLPCKTGQKGGRPVAQVPTDNGGSSREGAKGGGLPRKKSSCPVNTIYHVSVTIAKTMCRVLDFAAGDASYTKDPFFVWKEEGGELSKNAKQFKAAQRAKKQNRQPYDPTRA